MKHVISTLLILIATASGVAAQKPMEEKDRLAISVEKPLGIDNENAARSLQNNIMQAITLNGLSSAESRFTTLVSASLLSQNTTNTAPVMYVTELEIMAFIGDLYTGTVFGQASFTVKGVGKTPDKAYINAVQQVKARNPQLKSLILTSKDKILAYFDAEFDQIIARIDAFIKAGDYKSALIEGYAIPRASADLYNAVTERLSAIPASEKAGIDRSITDSYYFSGSREERVSIFLQ